MSFSNIKTGILQNVDVYFLEELFLAQFLMNLGEPYFFFWGMTEYLTCPHLNRIRYLRWDSSSFFPSLPYVNRTENQNRFSVSATNLGQQASESSGRHTFSGGMQELPRGCLDDGAVDPPLE